MLQQISVIALIRSSMVWVKVLTFDNVETRHTFPELLIPGKGQHM